MMHRCIAIVLVALGLGLARPAAAQATADALMYAPAADARLQQLVAEGGLEALREAAALYLRLLSGGGRAASAEEAAVFARHRAQLALVMPSPMPEGAGAGAALQAWWRRQDPLPATAANERLEEHLRRVAHAETHYPDPDRPAGLDDRGVIYLRYGVPARVTHITFDDPKLVNAVYQPGVTINLSDFPENEVWWYPHIDRAGYFLFVKKGARYREANTGDLLPNVLRYGLLGDTDRAKLKAVMLLAVMRSVYQQLALHHPDFAMRYQRVDEYAFRAEDAFDAGRGRQRGIAARAADSDLTTLDPVQDEAATNPFHLNPQDFLEQMLLAGEAEDEQARYQRQEAMPEQFTEVLLETADLPLSVRTARFLDDDGTTRTEIYWGPAPGGLGLDGDAREARLAPGAWSPDQFVVHLTALQQTPAFEERQRSQKPYLVTDLPEVVDAAIPAQILTLRGDTGVYNLALQWDQHRVQVSGAEGVRVGPRVKVATRRVDSLAALRADGRTLELSDLKPLLIDDLGALSDGGGATLYPHPEIWPTLPLGLYFEVYHLAFGADDQTHYTIAYEIAPQEGQGGLLRFLGRGRQARTVAETPYTGQGRTAREYILLDLSEWEGAGALEVRVTVTDDVTGRQATRSLSFEMVDSE